MITTGNKSVYFVARLQVVAQAVQFLKQIVNVLLLNACIGGDVAEKVGQIAKWLIADHQTALVHHASLQFGGDLQKLS